MSTINLEDARPLDLISLRRKLAQKKGKEYWRSLNELAESDEFIEMVRLEYPRQAVLLGSLNRRDFLKVLGASLAMAGLAACTPQQSGKILPYAVPPENLVPGEPVYFASAMSLDGYAQGVIVKSEMGRPIKVDGNPRHPVTQGTSNVFMQASILDLYDPDRAKQVTRAGQPAQWADFTAEIGQALSAGSGGLRILTGPVTSPSLNDQIQKLLSQYPGSKWHSYTPVGRANAHTGAQLVFGQVLDVLYQFDRANVILSLDSDFLFRDPGSVKYGREFAQRRQPIPDATNLNRLYVVESSLTNTGAKADHRLPLLASQIETFTRALAGRLGIDAGSVDEGSLPGSAWLDAIAADLQSAGSTALIVAGERQPPAVHALAYAMNQALGSVGTTLEWIDPVEYNPVDPSASLAELAQDLEAGLVDLLVILEGNPAYTAPFDLDFAQKISRAGVSVYLGAYPDETATLATWHVPAAHYLEAWGDLRSVDGTVSLVQPLIEPLYGGKSPLEVLAVISGQGDTPGYDLLRQFWQAQMTGANFETVWRQALADGVVVGTTLEPTQAAVELDLSGLPRPGSSVAQPALEVVFEPDPTIWDGQYANNAWLQELPKPLTKLTWDNAVIVGPQLAARLELADEDLVEVSVNGRTLQGGVLIQPGQPDNSINLTLGYGRQAGGKVLEGAGYNAFAIRNSASPWFTGGATLNKKEGRFVLATTRDHQTMENRSLVRSATLEEFLRNPGFAQEEEHGDLASLYDPVQYTGHAWGMSINLNTCIGCNACVLACQAENNIPTVGKDQVTRSREMHWLRVDRYFAGDMDSPEVFFEPVPCMHCETAPCEPVCPVEATSHSDEGINEMTYNRCVGTRYCSNNCPYKVRRFNFYKYTDDTTESLKALRNPDVSVRSRGVMEKCTYCIQRVNKARIQAEIEGRPILDGEVKTACQQACPANAIIFGDLNDMNSQARQLKETPLNYALLGELGTRPRTTYLASVKNPNPALAGQA